MHCYPVVSRQLGAFLVWRGSRAAVYHWEQVAPVPETEPVEDQNNGLVMPPPPAFGVPPDGEGTAPLQHQLGAFLPLRCLKAPFSNEGSCRYSHKCSMSLAFVLAMTDKELDLCSGL